MRRQSLWAFLSDRGPRSKSATWPWVRVVWREVAQDVHGTVGLQVPRNCSPFVQGGSLRQVRGLGAQGTQGLSKVGRDPSAFWIDRKTALA